MSRSRTSRSVVAAPKRARTSSGSRTRSRPVEPPAEPPKPAAGAELILRQQFTIETHGRKQYAVPEMLIVGNCEGFEYLARVFGYLAEQARVQKRVKQPLAPFVFGRSDPPINVRLSDDLAMRCVPIHEESRKATLRQLGITVKSRQRGSLFERYRQIAQTDYHKVAERIRE